MAIFTLIGGAIAGAVGLGTATLFGVSAGAWIGGGLALATSLALSYINRPKKTLSTAVQGQVQLGGDVDATVLFGTGKTKGHRIFYAKYGGGNAKNAEVFVLANGRCDGLEPYIYFYGEKHNLISVTPVANEHARYTVEGFGNSIVIRFYDGRPGQLPDSELVAATASLGNKWKATSVVAGHAYVVVERTWSASLFDKGRPDFDFVLRGWCEYDARKDSTVPGGSGPHRLNDPSTWEHSLNPAVHRLNFLLGLRGLESGDVLVGVGKPINQIDVAMHMVAANVCDAERTVEGRTIPTYHCNLFVSASDDHIAVLQTMEDAMAGYAVNRAGLDGVLAGAPQIPALEITAADIRADAPRRSKNRRSGFDGINILSGQFTSIEAHWKPESLTTVSVNADIAADGRKRPAGNDFLQVTDPDIGQYLLNIRYRQNRKARQRTLPVSRKVGCRIQPGDWVTYDGLDWLVTKWGFDAQFQFTVELSETGDDIYDEDGISAGPVVVPPSTPANPSLISTVANFGVDVGLIGEGEDQAPALQFTWDDPEDPTVTQVRIEYREHGTTEPVYYAVSNDPASGLLITGAEVVSGTVYDAQATITTVPDRFRTHTGWVTSPATGSRISPTAAQLYNEATGDRVPASDTLGDLRSSIYEQLHRITTEAGLLGAIIDTQLRESLRTTARFTETLLLIADETQARVQATTTLEATFTAQLATRATITYVDDAVATEAGARATAITAVQSTVDDLTSDVTVLAEAIDGVEARYGVAVQVGGVVGGFTITGLQPLDGSPVVDFGIQASSFWIVNPANTGQAQQPFLFVDGVLYVNEAVIPTLSANIIKVGRLQSVDESSWFDLDNGEFVMSSIAA